MYTALGIHFGLMHNHICKRVKSFQIHLRAINNNNNNRMFQQDNLSVQDILLSIGS